MYSLSVQTPDDKGGYEVLWLMTRDQAMGVWELGQVKIPGRDIVITAVKDNDVNKGYIAVDEFLVMENMDNCDTLPIAAGVETTTTATTSSPFPQDCDFEKNYCDWTSGDNIDNTTDLFVFIRTQGHLHTADHDGPEYDHSRQNTTYFLWTNAGFGKEGDVAAITGPSINIDESLCFNFWFDLSVSIF